MIYYRKFIAWSVPPFIVSISAPVEYGYSLISRPDLFYKGKYLVAPTFEVSAQRVFESFLWFFKLPYKTFHLLPSRTKNRMFKNWIHVCFNPFSLYLKINMDKTSEKVTKEPKRQKRGKKAYGAHMKKLKNKY